MLLLLLLAAQAAAAAPATDPTAPPPQQFSILVSPCASARDATRDVVVCGDKVTAPRLPLPDDRGAPDHPVPSNPQLTGVGALAASDKPCADDMRGCTVGFGGPVVAAALSGVGTLVSDIAKNRRDARTRREGGQRVAIDLDAVPTGHLEP